ELGCQKTSRRFRPTRRQRTIGTILTVCLFGIVLSTLLTSISGVGSLLTRTLFPPNLTATAVSRLGTFSFYLTSNPSWGQFTIDGQLLKHLPNLGREPSLNLAPGRHEIVWRAAPFNPRACVFTVVDRSNISSPCLLNHSISMSSAPLETRGSTSPPQ